jgi:hypothetical protein
MKYVILILVALNLVACGVKRDNPLDPNSHSEIVVPGDVAGLAGEAFGSGSNPRYVRLEWNSNNLYNTDGYYVYRSLGYNNAYAVIDTVLHATGTTIQTYIHSSENDNSVSPGDFWYKVSAYKSYSGGNLEGRMSMPVFVRVSN